MYSLFSLSSILSIYSNPFWIILGSTFGRLEGTVTMFALGFDEAALTDLSLLSFFFTIVGLVLSLGNVITEGSLWVSKESSSVTPLLFTSTKPFSTLKSVTPLSVLLLVESFKNLLGMSLENK